MAHEADNPRMNEEPQSDDARVAELGAWARSSLAKNDTERAAPSGDVDGARALGSVVAERYILKAYLGRGRLGEVYRAVDRLLSDPAIAQEHSVALQLLHRRLSQQTPLLQKLESAYEQPHLWAHPNVLRVNGFGCDRGQYFLATELLDGLSLRAVLDGEPSMALSERETLAVLRGVGDALKYAHAKGAIHGDIRPENVFITSDRAIKVLDLFPASPPRTLPFFVEDAQPGGLATADERDDVYGLACLAYELFAGRHPYNASSPLEAANAGLALAPIMQISERRWLAIARALALRRDERTPSVSAFLHEIGVVGDETLRPARDKVDVAGAAPPPTPPPATPVPPMRAQDDDVPIVGGYSGAASDGWRPPPLPSSTELPPSRNEARWDADPYDLEGYAEPPTRRTRRALEVALVLLLAAAVVAGAYWNSRTLRERSGAWLAAVQNALRRNSDESRAREPEPEVVAVAPSTAPPTVEAPKEQVAPTERTQPKPPAPAERAPPVPAAAERAPPVPAAAERGAVHSAPTQEPAADVARAAAPAAVPAEANAPESFEFASPAASVAESRGFALVEIRRHGGSLGPSSAVWWTSDGTATAPADYVGFGATIQKFAAGETTRTIRIPIVRDSKREGRKSFFVNLRGRELPVGRHEPPQRVEIVISDDD